jgi:hypothetical protein
LRIIFRIYVRALIIALCIRQIYKNIAMQQLLLLTITTVMLLLGGVVTIALIQAAAAGTIITTRSNIKSGNNRMEANGNDNQQVSQDAMKKKEVIVENNCGDGAECSVAVTNTDGDIIAGTVSVESGDTNTSADGNIEGDPIPGVDVKLGKNPGGQVG